MRSSSMAGGGRRSTTPLIPEALQKLLEAPRNEPWFGYWAAPGELATRSGHYPTSARWAPRHLDGKGLGTRGRSKILHASGPACALMEARAVEVEAAAVGV